MFKRKKRLKGALPTVGKEVQKTRKIEPKPAEEKELAATETKAIIDAMVDPLIVLSLDGEISSVNLAHLKKFGHKSIDEIKGKGIEELIDAFVNPEEDLPKMLELFRQVIQKGYTEEPIEVKLRRPDGTQEFIMNAMASVLKDADGNPKNVVATLRDITMLKRTEKERIQTKAEAAIVRERMAIIDAIPDALVILNPDGELIYVNSAHLKMLGHNSAEEVLGRGFEGFKERVCDQEKDIPKFLGLFKEVIEKGFTGGPKEIKLRRVDGKEIFVSGSASLLRDAEGNPENIIALLRDITELKRAEKERLAVERERAALIDAMPDSVVVVNLDGEVISCNQGHLRMFGFKSTDEALGKSIEGFKEYFCDPEKDVPRILEMFKEVIEKGIAKPTEIRLRRADGKELIVNTSGCLIRDAEDNPKNVVTVLKDITELKHLEEKEREEEIVCERAAIVDAMADPLVVLNLDGEVVAINSVATKMFGRKPEEIVGKAWSEISWVRPGDIERLMEAIQELIETGEVKSVETVAYAADGRGIPISVAGAVLKDAEGNPKHLIVTVRDITELKRAEEERAKAAVVQERAAVVDAMGDGLIITDLDGNLISFNRAMEEQFAEEGINLKELVGKSTLDLPSVRPEDVEKFIELIREAIEKGKAGPLETQTVTSGYWHSFTVSLMRHPECNPSALFAIVRDVTQRKKAE
ncbi:MAG: PAS domain-containing protein, partial [Desulfatiglandales bacterium]